MIDWKNGCSQEVVIDGQTIEVATIQGFECILRIIFNLAIRLAGIIVFIIFIIGGFKYLTAGGDQEKIQSAQKTLTYAIGGLVLIILAWFILFFIEKFTGIRVTIFEILR